MEPVMEIIIVAFLGGGIAGLLWRILLVLHRIEGKMK